MNHAAVAIFSGPSGAAKTGNLEDRDVIFLQIYIFIYSTSAVPNLWCLETQGSSSFLLSVHGPIIEFLINAKLKGRNSASKHSFIGQIRGKFSNVLFLDSFSVTEDLPLEDKEEEYFTDLTTNGGFKWHSRKPTCYRLCFQRTATALKEGFADFDLIPTYLPLWAIFFSVAPGKKKIQKQAA